jgi:hypothetical protein
MREWLTKETVAVGVSVLALALSAISLISASSPADVKLVLVGRVHLSSDPGARVYLQPTFVSTAANDRAEVIESIEATMTGADGATHPLRWAETGRFDVGPFPDYEVNWSVTAVDPGPIIVTPSEPQAPILQMDTPDGFTWLPGTYRIDVRAARLVSTESLVGSLTFVLADADVARLRQEGPARFVSFEASPDD